MENTSDNWQQSIMAAVDNHNAAELEQLIKSAENKSLDFYDGIDSPLTKAIDNWDYVITEKLLCSGANVDFSDKDGARCTPLMKAARNGNVRICRLLLKHGANVHAVEHIWSYTALHYATLAGQLETAALLLEHGAMIHDPTIPWHEQTSPIRVATQWEKPEMLSFLLEYCNKTDMEIPFVIPLIFHEAVHEGSDECAIIALKEGYYPASLVQTDKTYLQVAADIGSVKLMSVLVELNPHFLQEDWLVQNQLPECVKIHPEFVDWFTGYRKQPPSLQKLCRSVILSQLVIYCIPKVEELPLPRLLKTYLTAVDSAYDWS